MNLLAIHKDVTAAFKVFWTYTSIAWPNLKFDPSSLGEWVRLSVIPADSDQKSMGGSTNVHRQYGTVLIEIFIDQDSGAHRSVELADLAINFFHTYSLGEITFGSPDTIHLGQSDGWYKKNVACDFYSDNDF